MTHMLGISKSLSLERVRLLYDTNTDNSSASAQNAASPRCQPTISGERVAFCECFFASLVQWDLTESENVVACVVSFV